MYPEQLALGFEKPAPNLEGLDPKRRLERHLLAALAQPVDVTVTDNRRSMISARRRGRRLHVRLHHMFLRASEPDLDVVVRYLKGDRSASKLLGDYIERHRNLIRSAPRRPGTLKSAGQHHDLQTIFDELNRREFGGAIEAQVTWGRRARRPLRRRRRRSIRLGTYHEAHRLIRIHPVLDQSWVPDFFVRYILFHEMLHQAVPSTPQRGRRRFHGPEFLRRERSYPDYERALAWERDHLDRLLRSP